MKWRVANGLGLFVSPVVLGHGPGVKRFSRRATGTGLWAGEVWEVVSRKWGEVPRRRRTARASSSQRPACRAVANQRLLNVWINIFRTPRKLPVYSRNTNPTTRSEARTSSGFSGDCLRKVN